MAATRRPLARIDSGAWPDAARTLCKGFAMKILTTISIAAGLALAGFGGATAAQATDPATQPALAQADATAAVPPAAADANGNAAGAVPTVPDQAQAPANATVVAATVTNGPIPDTPANRAKYGAPMSHAGKRSAPAGN
jgi:hypothetical protein